MSGSRAIEARLGMETLGASKAAFVLDALEQQVEASRKVIEDQALQMAFLAWQLELEPR